MSVNSVESIHDVPTVPNAGFRARICALAAGIALLLALPAFAGEKLVVSIGTAGTVCDFDEGCVAGFCASDGAACVDDVDCAGCFTVENEDLAMCDAVSLGEGATQCRWSLFFDGSAAGLNSKVLAVDILPDGALVMRVAADGSIPDISGIKAKDLALFEPRDALGDSTAFQLPYAEGQWSLFLDGDAVKDASDARAWGAVEVLFPESCMDLNADQDIDPQECDVLLSLASGATLGTPPNEINPRDEDIIRCRPTLSPGGTISACEYSIFLDSSQINEPFPSIDDPGNEPDSFASDVFAYDFVDFDKETLSGTMIFRAGAGANLPPKEESRDLIEMVGTFGPSGACSATTTTRCITDGDCPGAETCGAPDANPVTFTPTVMIFDGDAPGARVVPDVAAGLQGETIQAFALVPDADADDVPDGVDNCPNDANPPEICRHGCDTLANLCNDGVTACTDDADCPFVLTVCTEDSDCAAGDFCAQSDTDLDGVGDACDQCNGRDDAVCECGDFLVDDPSEQCDLGDPGSGGFNGEPGSPCSATCQISGSCSQTPGICTTANDCPGAATGEGCCGNAVLEGFCSDGSGVCTTSADCRACVFGLCNDGVTACISADDCLETCQPGDEQCDDGNPVSDDICDNSCQLVADPVPLPAVCQDLTGPNVVPALVRPANFIDTGKVPAAEFDKWRFRGEFAAVDGLVIDPDTQQVDVILSQDEFVCVGGTQDGFPCVSAAQCPNGGVCTTTVFEVSLEPGDGDGHFIQQGPALDKPVWKFKNVLGSNAGAESWKRGFVRFRGKTLKKPLAGVKFNMSGRGDKVNPFVSFDIDENALGGPPPRVRATLRIGDICATQVLTCDVLSSGRRYRCLSLATQ